ncbi:hypothetical protein CRENBAI_000416 [Crenichthys baileyi]|uniref:Uncharacterized protein n=1 Tax=Crenichthys baileyi TaxID=28760 RepID=A0AAV9SE56_9TELE
MEPEVEDTAHLRGFLIPHLVVTVGKWPMYQTTVIFNKHQLKPRVKLGVTKGAAAKEQQVGMLGHVPDSKGHGVTGRCCGAAVAHQRAINLGSKGVEIQEEVSARCLTSVDMFCGVNVSCHVQMNVEIQASKDFGPQSQKNEEVPFSAAAPSCQPQPSCEIPILSADPVRIPERTYVCE